MKIKLNYVIIPLVTIIVGILGKLIIQGQTGWYFSLNLPSITPPKIVFPIVWKIIFILSTISALIIWNRTKNKFIISLFAINAFLNIFWSFLFFGQHLIRLALLDAILLTIVNYILVFSTYKYSKIASFLILPYAIWTTFAVYLNYLILILN